MSVAAQLRVPQIPELREPHDYQSEARAPTLEALQAAAALAPASRNDHTKVQATAPEPAAVSAAAAEVPRSRDDQPKAQAAVPEREALPAAAKVPRSQDDRTKGEAAAPNPEAAPAAAELPSQTKGEAAAPEPEALPAAAAAAEVQRSRDDQTKVQATSPQPEASAVLEAAVPRSQDDQTEVSGSTFEYGYDAQHGKAWRRVLHGPKKKGPIEWSLPAARDETKGLHDPVTFYFSDGGKYEPGTVTQDTC